MTSDRTVNELTLQYAASVAKKVYGRPTPVRWAFIRNFEGEGSPPPMTLMLRGGRGGAVRLKLYLAFLWFAAKPPHDVTYPARAWAGLLGLDDPDGNGARRITDAVAWLADHHFVRADRQRGRPSRVVLLREDGSGTDYELPGQSVEEAQESGLEGPELWRSFYIKIPVGFWINGWAALLPGASVAMLLALLADLADRPARTELWFSPSQARKRYGLSEETRSMGLRELERCGLIETRRRSISKDVFDFRRMRNTHVLHLEGLDKPAVIPAAV